MITLKSCPVCNSQLIQKYQVIIGGNLIAEIMPDVKVEAAIICHYSQCQDCHLIFQNPRLSDEELETYYSSGYYRRTINPPSEGMDKGEEIRAEIDSKFIKKYLGEIHSHLDIGCGRGYLLKLIDADIKVGIESDVTYVKFKEITVHRDLEQSSPKKFDLVTSIHSLEHVPHPLDYLRSMTKFIKKGGHIVIEVPSSKTRGGPLGFAHLHYFETDVLKLMCVKAGLEVVHVEFTSHLILICKRRRE